MDIRAQGTCDVGAARRDLTPVDPLPMAGFSFGGQVGRPGDDRIWAKCLYLRDSETGDAVAWVFLDLMSASLALHQAVAKELKRQNASELGSSFLLTGTHTHTAPGKFYGNDFYDRFASPQPQHGFDRSLTQGWARLIAEAIVEARDSARSSELFVLETSLFEVSYNRSLAAWRKNGAPLQGPAHLEDSQRAINPTLTVLVALRNGSHVASTAFYACHGTCLGPNWESYDRDWFGTAVDLVESQYGGSVAMGGGTSGDVSPRVFESGKPLPQGEKLKHRVGTVIGTAIGHCIAHALERKRTRTARPLPITFHSGLFEITDHDQWPRFQIGVSMLAGSEDGGADFTKTRWVSELINEGYRADEGPQAPKAPALGALQGILFSLLGLDIARVHPWHRVRLGDHLLCTMPGEPTGQAGAFVAERMKERLEVESVTVLGYSGDYAGYFTTPEEYAAQHYEGGSTLYGPSSLACFVDQAAGPDRLLPERIGTDDVVAPARSDLPARGLERLTNEAIEHPEGGGDRRFVFCVPHIPLGENLPRVRVRRDGEAPREAVVRRFPHPDRTGSPDISVLVAQISEDASFDELQIESEPWRVIVDAASARTRFSAPAGFSPTFPPRRIRPWFLLSAGFSALAFSIGMLAPESCLGLLQQPGGGMREFAIRMVALTPGLLAVEHYCARATPDAKAALGHALAGLLFWLGLFAIALRFGPSFWLAGFAFAGISLTGTLAVRVQQMRRQHQNPKRERWEFWPPLYFVSWLTALLGVAFIGTAPWSVAFLSGHTDSIASWLIALFGVGLLCNTVAMAASASSRDLRIVAGQLRGSLLFDCTAPVLVVLAVARGALLEWTLIFTVLFLGIDLWFGRLLGRAQRRLRWVVEEPPNALEVARRIRESSSNLELLRVLGSGHSVGPSVFAEAPPGPAPLRRSHSVGTHLSFERLDRIVSVDRDERSITVQAGMHLGVGPNSPRSADNNLLDHLALLDWALPDLGGIVHQTVGGFLATGSSGGSLRYSLATAIEELRFVDAKGRLQVARRGSDVMNAVAVSMGLLGPIVEVTFRCEPRYMIKGREFGGTVSDSGQLSFVARDGTSTRTISLSTPGELEAYLRESDYHRILWWPQKGVQKMAIWEASREPHSQKELLPYEAPPWLLQFVAGLLLTLVGKTYGKGFSRFFGQRFLPLAPWAIGQFIPTEPVAFYQRWDLVLPMDNQVDDYLLPTEFTEMWFPLEHAHQIMAVLLEMYRDPRVAGTFSCELYTAQRSSAWLSPAHERDVFRVDLFWFKNNRGDPVLDYFPQFWERLAQFSFRCHWGKHLPLPGSAQGRTYIAAAYPRLTQFKALRQQLDPQGTFATSYYRRHLDI